MRENKSFCTQGNCAFQADRMRNCHRRRCLCFGGFDARSAIADSGCPSCDIWGGLLYRMPCSCIHLYQEKSKVKPRPQEFDHVHGLAFAAARAVSFAAAMRLQASWSLRGPPPCWCRALCRADGERGLQRKFFPRCGFGIKKRTVHMRTVRFARNDGETEVYRKG